jgi:hypothetical protein
MSAAVDALRRYGDALRLRRNSFLGEIEIGERQGEWRRLEDADLRRTAESLQSGGFLDVGIATVRQAFERIADDDDHHPVREWLAEELPPWDGVPRRDGLFGRYFVADLPPETLTDGAGASPHAAARAYLERLGRRWLLGCVARIMRPGSELDIVPLISGASQSGILAALDALIPARWHCRASVSPHDVAYRAHGKWLVVAVPPWHRELGRLVTAPYDRGINGVLQRRQCAFLAVAGAETSERDKPVGFGLWPVRITRIETELIARDAGQLWAETLAGYRAGEPWSAGSDLEDLCTRSLIKCPDEDFAMMCGIEAWFRERSPKNGFPLSEITWVHKDSCDVPMVQDREGEIKVARILTDYFRLRKSRCWKGPNRGRNVWSWSPPGET